MLVFGVSLQAEIPPQGQTMFDRLGHLIAYVYADGTRDLYTYDSSWRMISFVGRNQQRTRYYYKADGTMVTVADVQK